MPLPLLPLAELASLCAPQVAPVTLVAIAKVESRVDPLAIHVNGPRSIALHPKTRAEAETWAARLLSQGRSADFGLLQINSRTLARLRLSAADAFDACRNLAGGARVLTQAYARARARLAPQAALRAALSTYNTGDPARGFRNGYVARVDRSAAEIVPALAAMTPPAGAGTPETATAPPLGPAEPASAPPPSLDVFATPSPVLVWADPARPGSTLSRLAPPRPGEPS